MSKPLEVTVAVNDIDVVTGFALSIAGCGEAVMQAAARLNHAAIEARRSMLADAGIDVDYLTYSESIAMLKTLTPRSDQVDPVDAQPLEWRVGTVVPMRDLIPRAPMSRCSVLPIEPEEDHG